MDSPLESTKPTFADCPSRASATPPAWSRTAGGRRSMSAGRLALPDWLQRVRGGVAGRRQRTVRAGGLRVVVAANSFALPGGSRVRISAPVRCRKRPVHPDDDGARRCRRAPLPVRGPAEVSPAWCCRRRSARRWRERAGSTPARWPSGALPRPRPGGSGSPRRRAAPARC